MKNDRKHYTIAWLWLINHLDYNLKKSISACHVLYITIWSIINVYYTYIHFQRQPSIPTWYVTGSKYPDVHPKRPLIILFFMDFSFKVKTSLGPKDLKFFLPCNFGQTWHG